ncbi:SDR family oxidoreductase [Zavarzinia compransoris]|uniref:Short-chain dehydrogenase n=1 Tax=Zavarzinia compransoris TaxID=1264899 RepID=A0A317DUA6_9PROT|nr:SDR family oxidoreductase [Zavarzinia compransoris]PWR18267.1 short-chain dehydrogenase [Zavarzinia compransoris]TDP43677.1 NAD(P)-dependent dehydrogenase (short-subunit alcohol dehydrogenase family) [Zavarzinia compransoris]
MSKPVILIIGASRGLGLGLTREYLGRGWRVIATIRDTGARAALPASPDLQVEILDIDDGAALDALRHKLAQETLDVLLVNAGVSGPTDRTAAETEPDEAARVFLTNAHSPVRLADALIERVRPGGTLAFLSSILGSNTLNANGTLEIYRASKAALNSLVISLALRHKQGEQAFLLLHPGWVRTDMGGPNAAIDIETSVRGLADTIEANAGGGTRYLDYRGQELPW